MDQSGTIEKSHFFDDEEIVLLDNAIFDALLKRENVIIPGFGYLETKKLADKTTVLFKSNLQKVVNTTGSSLQEEVAVSNLLKTLSESLKEGNVVSLPKTGIFRPIPKGDEGYRISFTISSYLRKELNSNLGEQIEPKRYKDQPVQEVLVDEKIEDVGNIVETVKLPEQKEDKLERLFDAKDGSRSEQRVEKIDASKEDMLFGETNIVLEKQFDKKINTQIKSAENPTYPTSTNKTNSKVGKVIMSQRQELEASKKPNIFKWVFIMFIFIAIFAVCMYFFLNNREKEPEVSVVQATQSTNLLDLAEESYGNRAFWIYIYDANSDKLTSPVNIPEGVQLRIPDLSEYNVDVRDSLEIKRANMMSDMILRLR